MATQQLSSRDIVVFPGDSITAGTPQPWYVPGVAAINAQFPTTTKPYPGTASGGTVIAIGGVASVVPLTFTPAITVINSGVGGNQVSDIATNVAARITDFNPTAVVMLIGINDCFAFNTPLAAFRASLDSIWTAVLAKNPACKLWGISLYVWGEMFNAGPVWTNAYDGPPSGGTNGAGLCIPDYNGAGKASVESFGGVWSESRNETLALIASLSAPPGAHVGPTTLDGLHPNTEFGQPLISSQWVTTVQVVTT